MRFCDLFGYEFSLISAVITVVRSHVYTAVYIFAHKNTVQREHTDTLTYTYTRTHTYMRKECINGYRKSYLQNTCARTVCLCLCNIICSEWVSPFIRVVYIYIYVFWFCVADCVIVLVYHEPLELLLRYAYHVCGAHAAWQPNSNRVCAAALPAPSNVRILMLSCLFIIFFSRYICCCCCSCFFPPVDFFVTSTVPACVVRCMYVIRTYSE